MPINVLEVIWGFKQNLIHWQTIRWAFLGSSCTIKSLHLWPVGSSICLNMSKRIVYRYVMLFFSKNSRYPVCLMHSKSNLTINLHANPAFWLLVVILLGWSNSIIYQLFFFLTTSVYLFILQSEDTEQQIIRETFHLVSKRDENVCNFLEGGM